MATQSTANIPTSRQQTSQSLRDEHHVGRDLVEYFREYAREKPEVVALWCFGIGFILGWKLKPW
jgi:hypothetical protein